MTGLGVAGGEMNFRRLRDADIEALIAGEPAARVPGRVAELAGALRSEFDATPTVGVGTALGEFLDVVDLTTTPTATSAGSGGGLGTKAAAVFGVLSVKMLLGAAVAAASVGGAHVLGVVDVPGLPNIANTVLVEIPEPAHDTSIQPPALIESDDGARGGQGEQDHLPVSEGPTPEPIAPTPDGPEPGDACEFGQETAEINAGSAAETSGNDGVPVDPCAINRDAAEASLDRGQAGEPGRPDDVPSDHSEGSPASRP